VLTAFEAIVGAADVILLAGDLTAHGEPEQAEVLAEACRGMETPVIAVLGNQHASRADELTEVLREADRAPRPPRSFPRTTSPCR
jgi:hypothetical protein